MERFGAPLAALSGGLLWALCFAREPQTLLAWVALAPLLWTLGSKSPVRNVYLGGVATWVLAIYWLYPTLVTYGDVSPPLALFLLLLLSAVLAGFYAVFAWLGARIWNGPVAVALWSIPALWVAVDWLRTHFTTGFPWNLTGYAWVAMPGALELSAWIGASGIGYLVALANTGLALGVARRRWDLAALALLVPLAALPVGARWAGPDEDPAGGEAIRVVQPNIENLTDWDAELVAANQVRLMALSREACDVEGALVVWPESAGWPYIYERDAFLRSQVDAIGSLGCGVLLNSPRRQGGGTYNSALLVRDGAVTGAYDKRHLVPWGEYVPLGELLPFVGKLARNAGQFSAGTAPTLLEWGEQRIGVAICYEVVFPEEVAAAVGAGATMLLSVTNDAWYGDTSAPWQHFRAAQFRAAESHRWMVRAAITGVSGVIGPDGSVRQQLGVREQGILRAAVPVRDGVTIFSRAAWLVPLLCSLSALAVAIFLARRSSG